MVNHVRSQRAVCFAINVCSSRVQVQGKHALCILTLSFLVPTTHTIPYILIFQECMTGKVLSSAGKNLKNICLGQCHCFQHLVIDDEAFSLHFLQVFKNAKIDKHTLFFNDNFFAETPHKFIPQKN